MNEKIVSIRFEGIQNYKSNEFKIDFFNYKRASHNYYELENLISSLYTHNLIGLIGTNASGKTMSIKLIQWCIDFFVDNSVTLKDLNKIASFDNLITVEFEIYSKVNTSLHKLELIIDNSDISNPTIRDETLKVKELVSSMTKSEMIHSEYDKGLTRNTFQKLLSRSKEEIDQKTPDIDNFQLKSQLSLTNYLGGIFDNIKMYYISCDSNKSKMHEEFNSIPISLVQYLDNSIEKIYSKQDSPTQEPIYYVTFSYGKTYNGTFESVISKLSSGTIRGISLFKKAIQALKTGGYLLVDEIEVSLHKALILDIIKLFNNRRTNPNYATLLFSTHYSEVIDSIRRNDAIYLCSKGKDSKINFDNYSQIIKRNDISKSDAYLSGVVSKPSAPSYQAYSNFLVELEEELYNNDNKETINV